MSAALLSLGTAQLGMVYGAAYRGDGPSASAAASLLGAAADLGIGALDTAPAYGLAEQWIGDYLAAAGGRPGFEICTKLPSLAGTADDDLAGRVADAARASLQRLRVERIDDYLIHSLPDLERYGARLVDALCAVREQGLATRIGVSVYGPADLSLLAQYPDLATVQHPYNLLDQRLGQAGRMAALTARGVRIQTRSVLLQGVFALEPDALPARLNHLAPWLTRLHRICAAHGRTAVDAALPFALALAPARVIVGADTPAQLEALAAMADAELPEALLAELTTAFAAVPESVIDPRTWPAA